MPIRTSSSVSRSSWIGSRKAGNDWGGGPTHPCASWLVDRCDSTPATSCLIPLSDESDNDSNGREVTKMVRTAWTVALVATGVCTAGPLGAQDWARTDVGWCDRDWGGSESDRHCHVLTAELADPGGLSIDGGTNGGVSVQGWNGDGVEVRAKVWANARTVARAEETGRGGTRRVRGERAERRGSRDRSSRELGSELGADGAACHRSRSGDA